MLSKEGTVDIPISSSDAGDSTDIFLFRFIMEEVDRFHKGAAYLPNYFGKLMAQVSSKLSVPEGTIHYRIVMEYFPSKLSLSKTSYLFHWTN